MTNPVALPIAFATSKIFVFLVLAASIVGPAMLSAREADEPWQLDCAEFSPTPEPTTEALPLEDSWPTEECWSPEVSGTPTPTEAPTETISSTATVSPTETISPIATVSPTGTMTLTPVPAPTATSGARPLRALPLGRMLLVADRSRHHEIYAMRLDGTDLVQLTSDTAYASWWPRLSPDRTKIAFYRRPSNVRTNERDEYVAASLWIMDTDGSNKRLLRSAGMDGWGQQGHVEWSPDGTQLTMFGGVGSDLQIYVTDAEGSSPRAVTTGGGIDPSWSPDGSMIIYVSCETGPCKPESLEVYTIPTSGGTRTRQTFNDYRDHDPYFSPDGTRIVWASETQPNAFRDELGAWNLFAKTLASSVETPVTNDRNISTLPRWSQDGSIIYFQRIEWSAGPPWSIYSIRYDGTEMRRITNARFGNAEYLAL